MDAYELIVKKLADLNQAAERAVLEQRDPAQVRRTLAEYNRIREACLDAWQSRGVPPETVKRAATAVAVPSRPARRYLVTEQ